MSKEVQEKRLHRRASLKVWATSRDEALEWIEPEDMRDDIAFCYNTSDISKGGIFLETQSPLPLGTEMELEFELPGVEETMKVKGRVVRTVMGDTVEALRRPGMGLEFIDIGEEEKRKIEKFITGISDGKQAE